jgi:hypothetical protein
MRSSKKVRWVICALAVTICVPAAVAVAKGKSLSECTSFDQEDKGEDAVKFTVKNSCTVPINCSLSWRVVCAPESKKRRSVHPASFKITLTPGANDSKEASATQCGDAGWTIDSIKWGCQPLAD